MSRVRVKICGITNPADAEIAIEAGADALGFVLWAKSTRAVAPASLGQLTADLPPFVGRIGVFVDAPAPRILTLVREGHLGAVQLHGREDAEFCSRLGVHWYRAFRVGDDTNPSSLASTILAFGCKTFMLDTNAGTAPGGSGCVFDWSTAAKISMHLSHHGVPRLILAGGLTPENVADAIRKVRPWAVDVSSGVERSPGCKDPDRVRAFIQNVREVE